MQKVNNYKKWVGETFDRGATEYGKKSGAFFNYFGERLVEHVRVLPGQHVLDIATGRGAVLFPLAHIVGQSGRAVGVDISQQMITETSKDAIEKGMPWIELLCMDAEDLDFPDDSFDLVFCGFGLFFLPSIPKALSECKRVLKPNGKLVISTWGEDSVLDSLISEEINKVCSTESLIASPLWSEKELIMLLKEASFHDIQIYEETKTFLHATAEEWWDSLWSHATRAKLEQISTDHIASLRKEVLQKASHLDTGNGINEELQVFYAIAQKT